MQSLSCVWIFIKAMLFFSRHQLKRNGLSWWPISFVNLLEESTNIGKMKKTTLLMKKFRLSVKQSSIQITYYSNCMLRVQVHFEERSTMNKSYKISIRLLLLQNDWILLFNILQDKNTRKEWKQGVKTDRALTHMRENEFLLCR